MRARGLAGVAGSSLLGSLLMHQLPSPPGASSSALLASAALLVWLLVSWRWPIWMVIGFLWTAYHIEQRLQLYFDPELAGQDLWVAGWVDSFPNHAPRSSDILPATRAC